MTRLLLLIVFFSLSVAAEAQPSARTTQSSTGELRLEVKDPSGKSLEAAGKLDNLATGVSNGFQTDSQGKHTVEGLPYGRYRLEVSSTEFLKKTCEPSVQLNFQQRASEGAARTGQFALPAPIRLPQPDGRDSPSRPQ